MTPKENPFYLDLPFDDVNDAVGLRTRTRVIRWAKQARYAALAKDRAPADPDPVERLTSARNRFVGFVTRIVADTVMAQVEIQAGPHRVVSLMSSESVRDLGLEVGSLAVAVVKSTNVIVEVPRD